MSTGTTHPFVEHPHRTLIGLSVPVLFSLVAEPVTGLVDTAFVARLGAEPLAALGVGTIALSSIFWIFNFLSIGTQTSVAQHLGGGDTSAAADTTGVALALAGLFSVLVIAAGWALIPAAAGAMEASGAVFDHAVAYMRVRLWGAPAVLVTIVCFGALRGVQDMRSPLWVALLINGLNVALDYPLIFGVGGFDGFGVAGAAAASAISQWAGALWAVWIVYRRLGRPGRLPAWRRVGDASHRWRSVCSYGQPDAVLCCWGRGRPRRLVRRRAQRIRPFVRCGCSPRCSSTRSRLPARV